MNVELSVLEVAWFTLFCWLNFILFYFYVVILFFVFLFKLFNTNDAFNLFDLFKLFYFILFFKKPYFSEGKLEAKGLSNEKTNVDWK